MLLVARLWTWWEGQLDKKDGEMGREVPSYFHVLHGIYNEIEKRSVSGKGREY